MIGIDEVGRGSWAGPLLVVAARQTGVLPMVADSKKLTAKKREALVPLLLSVCDFGEGWASALEVDALGLTQAMRLAVHRATTALNVSYDEAITMDGPINYLPANFVAVRCLIDADALEPIVSAASIYAKVRRDDYMRQYDRTYPLYGFKEHVGYGTKKHAEALRVYGLTPEHRKTFKPVKRLVPECASMLTQIDEVDSIVEIGS